MLRFKNNPILKAAIFIVVAFSALCFFSNAQAGGVDVDFKQASNKNPTQGDVVWIGSILQENNSTYYEGMSSLQRLILVGIPKTPGNVHTLTLKHQANKGVSHAYDFLTSWPQALQAADEIGGPTMFVNLNECGPDIGPPADLGAICIALHSGGFTVTPDAPVPGIIPSLPGDDVPSVVANYEAHFGNRTVKIYGNAPISASTITFDGYSGSGDMDAEYTFSWTSGSDSIIIEMAGHLAVGMDPLGAGIGYGEGLGAANISGGPYHFSLSELDGSSLGSQDNQIKGADILLPPPPVCDVTPPEQDGCVGFDASFTDNSTGGIPPYTYCWQKEPYTDPCISTTSQLTISGATLADAGTYRVIVIDARGYADTCYAELIVYPPPGCDVIPDRDSVCSGCDASFTASGSGGTPPYSYDWSGPDGFTATTATININNAQLVNAGTYEVIVADAYDCADTCYAELIVFPPLVIIVSEDDSVHAGDYFVSTDFSVSGGHGVVTVSLCGITPAPVHQPTIVGNHVEWQTECADDGRIFTLCLEAADDFGAIDTGYFDVTVYNQPPGLTCPNDGVVTAVDTFLSTDFSVIDPDGDPASVSFLDINPIPTYDPEVIGNHVEWVTTLAEQLQSYVIRLVAADHCGLADTCEFTVTVDVATGDLSCPDDDSAHAGELFISSDFNLTGPGADPSLVSIVEVDPTPTNMPVIVDSHVEWQTDCVDTSKVFSICLKGPVPIGEDTCCFQVTVYNRPPEIICPDDDSVYKGYEFVSSDFLANDPDGENVSVTILDVYPPITDPPPIYEPIVVENHVEWITIHADVGIEYIIRLVATDACGLKDTCAFTLKITLPPHPCFAISVKPDTQYVTSGQAAGYVVTLHSILAFHEPCSLFVSGLPDPPASGIFNKSILTPTDSTTLNVYTTTETDTGWYTLTITGKEISGSIQRSRQVHLKVLESTDAGDWEDNPNVPKGFALFQNQPNPFNPETRISYYLPRDCPVKLTIYNVLGQRVKTLFDGNQQAGIQTLIWDGRDNGGAHLSSGIYFYRLQADDFHQTKKMVLMK